MRNKRQKLKSVNRMLDDIYECNYLTIPSLGSFCEIDVSIASIMGYINDGNYIEITKEEYDYIRSRDGISFETAIKSRGDELTSITMVFDSKFVYSDRYYVRIRGEEIMALEMFKRRLEMALNLHHQI